jgi:CRISPR-associated endoribonuclease Cas2 subtype I-E
VDNQLGTVPHGINYFEREEDAHSRNHNDRLSSRLRGDLSKWLQEINTGVYVGNVNSRVRDAIWNRVCENLKTGRATMVFSTNNEQKMDFRVHNTLWTLSILRASS